MTPEQLAALRAAAEKATPGQIRGATALEWANTVNAATILGLLDHIAKLEAGRDAVLEEAANICDENASHWIAEVSPSLVIRHCAEEIRALKSAPITDDQRHEAVAKILKDTP